MTKLIHRAFPNFPPVVPREHFNVFDDVDRLFSSVFGPLDGGFHNVSLAKGFPKGDIYLDDDGNTVIELILAGYSKEQLSVKVVDDRLIVSASKCNETDGRRSKTRKRSAFTKEFPFLTDGWALEKTEVSYRDGLLTLVVPPAEKKPELSKEITIK